MATKPAVLANMIISSAAGHGGHAVTEADGAHASYAAQREREGVNARERDPGE